MSTIERKDIFVGREKEIEIFKQALDDKFGTTDVGDESAEPKVLVYHGVAGIGKTSLCDHLSKIVLKEEAKYAALCKVDFRNKAFTEPEAGLFQIRNQLSSNHKMKFPGFDIAYGIFWKKVNPEKSFNDTAFASWGKSEFLTDVIGTLADAPAIGWIPKIGSLIERGFRKYSDKKTIKSKEILQKLPNMEGHEILDLLPQLLAEDITLNFEKESPDHKSIDSQPTIIFFDTYEELWGEVKENLAKPAKDKWIIDFATACRHALIVITGKLNLKWQSRYGYWDETRLEQHEILGLTKDKAIEYLIGNSITDKNIQDRIYQGSEGVPLYLDVSIDTYNAIINDDKTPVKENFGDTYQEVLERFTDKIPIEDFNALQILSCTRYWDVDVFGLLKSEFSDNFIGVTIKGLQHYSSITINESNQNVMHDLMRGHLQAYFKKSKDEPYEEVHETLFDYYNNSLKDLKPIDVSEFHKQCFDEAFNHASILQPINEFASWAMIALTVFNDAAQYSTCEHYYIELLGLLNNEENDTQIPLSAASNNLALLYESQGRYEEAEPLYLQAIDIDKTVLGENHPDYAIDLNNLAGLYRSQGHYEEAEPLYKQAIGIDKVALGEDHPNYARDINNLALLYNDQGRYEETEPLYKKAIEIDKVALGENHPDYAIDLNNLAALYVSQGRYEEAEPLYKQAIGIDKVALGEDHPNYARDINNLAGLYYSQGRYEEAELLYFQALSIFTDAFGELHPNVIITHKNIGVLYYNWGKKEKAQEFHLKAEALQKQRDELMGKSEESKE